MVLDNLNVTQTADLGDSSHPSSLGENPKHKILTLASINPIQERLWRLSQMETRLLIGRIGNF